MIELPIALWDRLDYRSRHRHQVALVVGTALVLAAMELSC
jgi:hypothetical protein